MFFVLAQYWPYLVAALIAGLAVGWWVATPAGRSRRRQRAQEAGK